MQKVFLTTREMAQLMGISHHTLASYARKGLLQPSFRLPNGDMRWFVPDAIEQLLTSDQHFDVSSDIFTKILKIWREQ